MKHTPAGGGGEVGGMEKGVGRKKLTEACVNP